MPATASVPQLRTPGVIAAELGEPLHRVLHILATRTHIRPSARAGTLRLYAAAALDAVRDELRRIDLKKGVSDDAKQQGP